MMLLAISFYSFPDGDLPLEEEMLLLGDTWHVVAVQRQTSDCGMWFPEPCSLALVQDSEESLYLGKCLYSSKASLLGESRPAPISFNPSI